MGAESIWNKLMNRGNKVESADPMDAERDGLLANIEPESTRRHAEFRDGKKNPDGSYKPRFKALQPETDKEWMIKNPGLVVQDPERTDDKDMVNISELPFEKLPPSRQEDSMASSRTSIEAIYRAHKNGVPLDEKFVDTVADTIHEQWLLRNGANLQDEITEKMAARGLKTYDAAKEDTELAKLINQLEPYSKLTEENKEYDRDFVQDLITQFNERQAAKKQ